MRIVAAIVFFCALASSGTVDAEVIKVVLLGTGGPRPDPARAGAAVMVEAGGQRLLFDSGRNVVTRLWQAGYAPGDVDRVFLTHLHSDHIVGLPDLWLTGWIWQRRRPLHVSGPIGTTRMVRHLQAAYAFDRKVRSEVEFGLDPAAGVLEGADVDEGVVYQHADVRVSAFRVDHGSVRPALGYRVDYGGQSVLISGDTSPSASLIEHARNADLLIHEVAAAREGLTAHNPRLKRILGYHTQPSGLAKVLAQTQPRLTVLTHWVLFGVEPEQVLKQLRARCDCPVIEGVDLLWVDVGEQIVVHHAREKR